LKCCQRNYSSTDSAKVNVFSVVLARVSSDNCALSTYSSTLGWRRDSWHGYPSHTGTVVIHRLIIEARSYFSNNSTPYETLTNQDDTSLPAFRDDDPQSGGSAGKVYDLDAPGFSPDGNPVGTVVRRRVNFVEYTTVGGHALPGSVLTWYLRQSIIKTSSGDQPLNDISGDNTVGSGSTVLTWNLQ
jgi:hypothetical protein